MQLGLNILESIKSNKLEKYTKFYQASTSEMFGNTNSRTISEKNNFEPLSPYHPQSYIRIG